MKFAEMTAPQLRAVNRENTVVLIPISAIEQHGPHLPTGTDMMICGALCSEVESRCPEQVLMTPTLWLGASAHHLRFGATLTAELDSYIATLCEIAQSLLHDGFQRLMFVNGHGGNVDPLQVALRELQPDFHETLLLGGSYWSIAGDVIASTLEGDHKTVGHACEFETSMIMHLRPELVDHGQLRDAGELVSDRLHGLFNSRDMMQRTKEGCTGRPDLATPEKGAAMFAGIVEAITAAVDTALAQPLASDYDEFVQ
jgi:creatinine amidohydrolase